MRGRSSSRFGVQISDFCLTQGVPGKTPIFLAVKGSLRGGKVEIWISASDGFNMQDLTSNIARLPLSNAIPPQMTWKRKTKIISIL